jgi:hypothetical protein
VERRAQEFLTAVDRLSPEQLIRFFPRAGELTYRHTVYTDEGVTVSETRYPAAEIPAALEGPLWPVLTLQQRGQRIGLFAHQVAMRGTRWRQVGSHRFAPRGEGPGTAIYVRMELEDGVWVVAEIADESFRTDRLPAWCC